MVVKSGKIVHPTETCAKACSIQNNICTESRKGGKD